MSTHRTPLSLALSGQQADERATPLAAFHMARNWWLEGRRLNLSQLAGELGVGRATLMRWVGNKDLLMGEILWFLYRDIYQQAIAQARTEYPQRGIEFLCQIHDRVMQKLLATRPLHDFLAAEPQWGLQLLTADVAGLQQRLIEEWEALFREEISAGRIQPELDARSLAHYLIRIGERAMYCDLICGQEHQPEPAAQIFRLLVNGQGGRATNTHND